MHIKLLTELMHLAVGKNYLPGFGHLTSYAINLVAKTFQQTAVSSTFLAIFGLPNCV
jgi:hypothetical protein